MHSLSAAVPALRQMSQARHVGKVVVRAATAQADQTAGTIVVTGGLGTLGSLTAAWLAQGRSLHVHATGRTGRFAASADSSLAALVAAGFSGMLSLSSADAAAAEDASSLMSSSCLGGSSITRAAGPAVVGILHASGVLADATLRNQTLQGMRTVWAPKVAALRQLSAAYGAQPGAFQLLFSSVAALLGSPGQANSSAANAALDAISFTSQEQVSRTLEC